MNPALPVERPLGALTVFLDDLRAEVAFYRDVLGLEVAGGDDVSTVFMVGGTVLNLLEVAEAPELVAPAPSEAISTRAQVMLSVWVDDVDVVCADLRARGVRLLNGPVDRSWGKRTAAFASPGGLVWEVAEDL